MSPVATTILIGFNQYGEDEDENVSDAGIDVVNRQVKQQDPLTEAELRQTFALHSQVIEETRALANKIQKRFL